MAGYSQYGGPCYERVPLAKANGPRAVVSRALLAGAALVLIFAPAMIWGRPQAAQTPLPVAGDTRSAAP